MANQRKLKLMVFDLDCTLWPFHVECSYSPPFKMKGNQVVDARGSKMSPYPEVLEVLEKWSKRCQVAAASRTHYPEGAETLLEFFGFNKYITYKEIYPGCKLTHFKRIKERANVEFSEMIFFDDEYRNIKDVGSLGVECVLIDEDVGVTKKIVEENILEKFSDT